MRAAAGGRVVTPGALRGWLAAAVFVATVGVGAGVRDAAADGIPAGIVTPPPGWTAAVMPAEPARQGAITHVSASSFTPAGAGAVLYVTRTEIGVTSARRDAIASAELGELEGTWHRHGAGAVIETAAKRADASLQQLDATVTWSDRQDGLADHSRTIVAATAGTVVAVTGDCVLSLDAPPAFIAACDAALRTLEIDLATEVRVAVAIVDATDVPTQVPVVGPSTTAPVAEDPGPPPAAPAGPSTTASSMSSPMVMSDGRTGTRGTLAPIVVGADPAPAPDRRPVYVGAGMIAFAALFWWNRKRRDRFEREDGRPVRRPRAERRSRGEDSDDLHAAASGDRTETEESDDKHVG